MAGSGTAHLRDRRRGAAAGREPGRRVPRRPHRSARARGLRREHRRDAGRDARPRRRVGLRQVDDRQGDHAAAAPELGRRALRRPGPHDAVRRAPAQDPHAHEDDLPGPDLVAEPAAQGRGHHRRGPADLEDRIQGPSSRRRSTRSCSTSASTPSSSGASARTSSPVASASASPSRARSSPTRR